MTRLPHPVPLLWSTLIVSFCYPLAAAAQRATSGWEADSIGIPVTSALVSTHCGACHAQDSTGRMTRISFMRKTPEGWQTSIRRMVMLNGVQLDPTVARDIVRYLSNHHGLAPDELRPGRFEVERRMIDYTYEADEETETTCKQCHSLGRVITQRRTEEEWDLLIETHRGYYPFSDFQAFRRGGPPSPDDEDSRQPMEKAVAHLSSAFPLDTPEWRAWSATMRPARLQGEWLISGQEPGRGPIFGHATLTESGDDNFTTTMSYKYARSGQTVTRTGRATVYTGFQWRGRSSEPGDRETLREVMLVERDWREMSGRWFRGDYDEFGLDVTLWRVGREPMIAGTYPTAIRTGRADQEVRVYGSNLPTSVGPTDVDFGPGVKTERIVRAAGDMITVRVSVAPEATIGTRDLFVRDVSLSDAITVFDRVSRIRVVPAAGMARVGGTHFPKQFQQFEAVAYHDGADGKPDTDDDLDLGIVDVTWSLEEYAVTYDDDDIKFVGSLDQHGLFTPALDGPNPERSRRRDNVGDVWVVATYQPEGESRKPLRARAHLLVTVPLYLRWDPWSTGR
jgi:quinohemoprotein amine dehydrogenase